MPIPAKHKIKIDFDWGTCFNLYLDLTESLENWPGNNSPGELLVAYQLESLAVKIHKKIYPKKQTVSITFTEMDICALISARKKLFLALDGYEGVKLLEFLNKIDRQLLIF